MRDTLTAEESRAWHDGTELGHAFRSAVREELTSRALDADGDARYVRAEVLDVCGESLYAWDVDTEDPEAEYFDSDVGEAVAKQREILDRLAKVG